MPRSTHCCACFTVRTGTLIVGWLGFISTLLGILMYGFAKANERSIKEILTETLLTPDSGLTNRQREEIDFYNTYLSPFLTAAIIYCALMLVIHGVLLIGVYKKKCKLMLPWMVTNLVMLALNFTYTIGAPIYRGADVAMVIPTLIGALLGMFVALYFWMCIYNHYQDLKENHCYPKFEPIQNKGPPLLQKYEEAIQYQNDPPPKYQEKP